MTLNGWLQIAIMLALVLATARPLGAYMASVLEGNRTLLAPALRPVESRFYAMSGVDETREQTWFQYVSALLMFNAAGFLLLYAILRLQWYLPLNPQVYGRRALLEQIREETEGLDEMVRNLLAMTRIDAGALELRRDWTDLKEIAGRVVAAARRHGARQSIEMRMPADLPMVQGDAKLIEQTLGNVIANAVAHTPAETRVVIDAVATPTTVVLRVTDDGGGIASDMLPHIFEKFVHARSKAARAADGGESTGLGLAIAKGIMDAHGGSIAAISPVAEGRGTRVDLAFPLGEAAP